MMRSVYMYTLFFVFPRTKRLRVVLPSAVLAHKSELRANLSD